MGMVIAAVATLTFSGFCFVWKKLFGYQRLTLHGFRHVEPAWRVSAISFSHVRSGWVIAGVVVTVMALATILH
jgi:hypothetical protein